MEIGTGLNTRFERVDNRAVHWIDLDLPDAIELRRWSPRRDDGLTSLVRVSTEDRQSGRFSETAERQPLSHANRPAQLRQHAVGRVT